MPCTQGLYCYPAQDAQLYPQTQYTLEYNSKFSGINGQKYVDIYLYQADQQGTNLLDQIASVTNVGQYAFTVNKVEL
jgi:hypothetical protein